MHIHEVHIETDQIEAQARFYRDTLGLPVEAHDNHLHIEIGATRLVYTPGDAHRYHLAFNIPENLFTEGKAWLAVRTDLAPISADSDHMPFPAWMAHSVYFYDAAGNILEFIARHRLPNASTDAFSPRSLLNISEVGMGTPDVAAARHHLHTQGGFPVFDGAQSDTFSALGDDHGLFIIVGKEREWFPHTGIPAGTPPLTVVVEDAAHLNVPGTPYIITPPAQSN